ncbi:MAG: spore coat protein CotJB [Clostridia bacterium]|nr:spore coat protein CotJB [Clostridia bacterium]
MDRREMMLKKLQMADFAAHEAALYLDLHPQNPKALEYFTQHKNMAATLRKSYEQEYGPLTPASGADRIGMWDWISGPWPWEGEA